MARRLGESHEAFLGEFLSRDEFVDEEWREEIFQRQGGFGLIFGEEEEGLKKAPRRVIKSEKLEGSVAMSEGTASSTM